MARKKLKIGIAEVLDSDLEIVAYYAPGRFTPKEFLKAAQKYHDERLKLTSELTDEGGGPLPKKLDGKVVNEFWRIIEGDGDREYLFKRCDVRDEGAYAVTVYDLARWTR